MHGQNHIKLKSLYTSSTTKLYYIKGYMFRPYRQVIIEPNE